MSRTAFATPRDRGVGRSFADTGTAASSGILVAAMSAIRATAWCASRRAAGGSISSTSESISEGLRGLFKQMRSLGHSLSVSYSLSTQQTHRDLRTPLLHSSGPHFFSKPSSVTLWCTQVVCWLLRHACLASLPPGTSWEAKTPSRGVAELPQKPPQSLLHRCSLDLRYCRHISLMDLIHHSRHRYQSHRGFAPAWGGLQRLGRAYSGVAAGQSSNACFYGAC